MKFGTFENVTITCPWPYLTTNDKNPIVHKKKSDTQSETGKKLKSNLSACDCLTNGRITGISQQNIFCPSSYCEGPTNGF